MFFFSSIAIVFQLDIASCNFIEYIVDEDVTVILKSATTNQI